MVSIMLTSIKKMEITLILEIDKVHYSNKEIKLINNNKNLTIKDNYIYNRKINRKINLKINRKINRINKYQFKNPR